jgi:hypothetical protein
MGYNRPILAKLAGNDLQVKGFSQGSAEALNLISSSLLLSIQGLSAHQKSELGLDFDKFGLVVFGDLQARMVSNGVL